MVVNIVTFDGEWEQAFPAATDQSFMTPSGPKSVPMLHGTGLRSSSFEGDGFSALTLPYKDNSLAMSLVLPAKGNGLDTVIQLKTLRQVMENSSEASANATFPKFKFSTRT